MGLNDSQPPLTMIDWSEFLRRVWGDSTGWAFIAYAGGGQFKHRAYKYPDQLGLLVNDAEELNRWANVYFCPHLFQTNAGRMKENALGGRALWVDKDGPFEELEPRPTICWQTSEGRHQALWLLDGDVPPDVLEQASKYMTYSTKSDKGGWHLGKVIRFPCSFNYKYAPPQQGLLLWDDGPVYSLEDLAPKEQVQLEEAIAKAAEHQAPKMPRKLPSVTEALIAFGQRIPTSAWELLNATPTREQDWSENLWKLERLLLEAGIPLEHTFVVVRESPWNKYKRDGRPDEHLWQEVFKASLEEGPLRDRPEDLPWVTLSELIVYSERPEWLVEGMWMDKNVGWIAGMGKSYKSVLSTDLALSVASGVPFLGKYEVKKPGPVLLVQEEDPLWRVAHRVQVMCQQKGIRMNRMSGGEGAFVIESDLNHAPLYASVGGGFLFKDERTLESLERAIDRYRPRLVVIDPLFMVAAGIDEYKAGEMVEPLNMVKRWRNIYGSAFAIVHHYRKGTGSGRERLYGSMALYSWSENSLFISRLGGESSTILIERDIKDALVDDPVSVEFFDIDEVYDYRVFEPETEIIRGPAEIRVVEAIRDAGLGNYVDRQSLAKRTGLTPKTVSKIVHKLKLQGQVLVSEEGRGGKLVIRPLPALYEAKDITEVIL